jgi:hypothetical protein
MAEVAFPFGAGIGTWCPPDGCWGGSRTSAVRAAVLALPILDSFPAALPDVAGHT